MVKLFNSSYSNHNLTGVNLPSEKLVVVKMKTFLDTEFDNWRETLIEV